MLDLFTTSFNAIRKYTNSHIENDANRTFYNVEASKIAIEWYPINHNFEEYIQTIKNEQGKASIRAYKPSWFSNERRYTLLAYEHALQVLESLKQRFVTGGSRAFTNILRSA